MCVCVCVCVCVCYNGVHLGLPYMSCPPQVLQCVTLVIPPAHILLCCPHTPIYLSSYHDYSEMLLEFGSFRGNPGEPRKTVLDGPRRFFFSRQSIVIASFRDGVRSKKLLVRTQLTIKKSHSSVRWSISSCASSLPPAGTCSPCRIRCTCFLCGSARR